jgi:hypothetical protein
MSNTTSGPRPTQNVDLLIFPGIPRAAMIGYGMPTSHLGATDVSFIRDLSLSDGLRYALGTNTPVADFADFPHAFSVAHRVRPGGPSVGVHRRAPDLVPC